MCDIRMYQRELARIPEIPQEKARAFCEALRREIVACEVHQPLEEHPDDLNVKVRPLREGVISLVCDAEFLERGDDVR